MRNEIFRSQRPRPFDFAPESRDRHLPQPRVLGSKINQIIIVDDERREAVLPSRRPKPFAILRRRLFCPPAARIRRKDLEGVAADATRAIRRIFKPARDRSVYAYSHKLRLEGLKLPC